jgi:hypothetical protein
LAHEFSFFITQTFFLFVDKLMPEARGPLKSGDWGGRPTCHPQTLPVTTCLSYIQWESIILCNGNAVSKSVFAISHNTLALSPLNLLAPKFFLIFLAQAVYKM